MSYTLDKNLIIKLKKDLDKVSDSDLQKQLKNEIGNVGIACICELKVTEQLVKNANEALYYKNNDVETISQWERAEAAEQKEQNIIAENKNKWEAIKNKPWYCFPQKIVGVFTCRNDMRNAQSRLRGIENWKTNHMVGFNEAGQRSTNLELYYNKFPENKLSDQNSMVQLDIFTNHYQEIRTKINEFKQETGLDKFELLPVIEPELLPAFKQSALDSIKLSDDLLKNIGIEPELQAVELEPIEEGRFEQEESNNAPVNNEQLQQPQLFNSPSTTSGEEQPLQRASFNIEPAPYVPFWEQLEPQKNLYLETESFTQRRELQ